MNRKTKNLLILVVIVAVVALISIQFLTSSTTNTGKDLQAEPTISAANEPERATIEGDETTFEHLDLLEAGADAIVVGTPTLPFEERDHQINRYADGVIRDYYTVTEFSVDQVIKDEGPTSIGDTVEFIEPLSLVKEEGVADKIWTVNDYREVKTDKSYIIFLKANPQGQYVIINNNNGKFSPDRDQASVIEQLPQSQRAAHIELRQAIFDKYDL